MIGEIEVRWPRRDERGAFRCIVSMGGDVTSKEVGLLSGYHEVSPPPGIVDSTTYMGDEGKIFDDKGVIGKIFILLGLGGEFSRFRCRPRCMSALILSAPHQGYQPNRRRRFSGFHRGGRGHPGASGPPLKGRLFRDRGPFG